jgi:type VI secretion system secreted protein VgrG
VNSRIFQNLSVPDIVEKVLKEGSVDFKNEAVGPFKKREYCVQYRESDLAFVSRLLEEEGIFYWFRHFKDQHLLVIGDSTNAVKAGLVKKLPMGEDDALGNLEKEVITEVRFEHRACSGKVTVADYFYEEPSNRLLQSNPGTQKGAEIFDYPAKFEARDDGDRLSRLRMEAVQATQETAIGKSNSPAIASGYKLDFTGHYRKDMNKAWQVLSVRHTASQRGYRGGETMESDYSNTFVAIPADVPFRPPITTRKPRAGAQPAVVVGPSGDEIYTDKYGRVKVQFFWDREGKKDDKTTCWMRVATLSAGKQWGFVSIPRVGQEVVVDFYEGDPDQPIIIGNVWNAEQMPPYALPANKTQSGWKTHSSAKGSADNFNELRFEDKKGSEQVFVQAEKDLNTVVKNDETRDVGHDRKTTIKNDETKTVTDGNEKIRINKGNQNVSIHGNRGVTIETGNDTLEIQQGNRGVTIEVGDDNLTISEGNRTVKLDMGNHELHTSMGNITVKADLGEVSTEAMQGIELKVGQSSIKLDQMGVTISGMMVKIEGQISTEVKGMMTQVSGDGMLTAKGGITMIN